MKTFIQIHIFIKINKEWMFILDRYISNVVLYDKSSVARFFQNIIYLFKKVTVNFLLHIEIIKRESYDSAHRQSPLMITARERIARFEFAKTRQPNMADAILLSSTYLVFWFTMNVVERICVNDLCEVIMEYVNVYFKILTLWVQVSWAGKCKYRLESACFGYV